MDDEKPDLEHGIYRVRHSLTVGEGILMAESDLIFGENDQPILVLEWGRKPDGEQYPDATLTLDPALLTASPGPPDTSTIRALSAILDHGIERSQQLWLLPEDKRRLPRDGSSREKNQTHRRRAPQALRGDGTQDRRGRNAGRF